MGLLHAAPRLMLRSGKEAVSSTTGGLGGNPAPTLSLSDLEVAVGGAVRLRRTVSRASAGRLSTWTRCSTFCNAAFGLPRVNFTSWASSSFCDIVPLCSSSSLKAESCK